MWDRNLLLIFLEETCIYFQNWDLLELNHMYTWFHSLFVGKKNSILFKLLKKNLEKSETWKTNKQIQNKRELLFWLEAFPVLAVSWNMLKRVFKTASCGLSPPAWHEQGDYKGTHICWSLFSAHDTDRKLWAREGRHTVTCLPPLKKLGHILLSQHVPRGMRPNFHFSHSKKQHCRPAGRVTAAWEEFGEVFSLQCFHVTWLAFSI